MNFPGCGLNAYQGVAWDAEPAQTQFFLDRYEAEELGDGCKRLTLAGIPITQAPDSTDIRALMDGYISVSRVKSAIYTVAPDL